MEQNITAGHLTNEDIIKLHSWGIEVDDDEPSPVMYRHLIHNHNKKWEGSYSWQSVLVD